MRTNSYHRGHEDHAESTSKLPRPLAIVGKRANSRRLALTSIPFLLAALFIFSAECRAQDNPILKIDDDITRFAYSAGGRIAYSTRHVFSAKKIDLQRDDIWICEPDGKRHRILDGQKFVRGTGPFSYTVHAIRWSPDGTKLAIELATSEMVSNNGAIREGVSTLLLDDSGREITTSGGDSVIAGASNAAWVGYTGGGAIIYLKEYVATPAQRTIRPSPLPAMKLFSAILTRMTTGVFTIAGPNATLWGGQPFLAVDWEYNPTTGIAIEPGLNETDTPSLVWLDIMSASTRQLTAIESYAGGLTLSPFGKRVAYWIDNGQLEIRDVDAPNRAVRLRVPIGVLAWSGDETRVLVKRGAEARTEALAWFTVPPLASVAAGAAPRTEEVPPQSVLHDLGFRLFDISPDGKFLAVVEPGRHNLLVYPIS